MAFRAPVLRSIGAGCVVALTEQTFLLVLVAGALGAVLPSAGARLTGALFPLLALMMLGVGVQQAPRELFGSARELMLAVLVVAVQLTVLPALAFGVSRTIPAGDTRLGLLMIGLAPAEVTSALATLLALGAAGFALCVLQLSLIASTVTIPAWLALLTTLHGHVDATGLFDELILAVVLPLAGASLLRVLLPAAARAERAWSSLSAAAVLGLIFIVAGGIRQLHAGADLLRLGIALLLLVAACYLLGLALGALLRPAAPARRAILFTTGMREFGVAAAVATSVASTEAGAVAALYGVLMMGASFRLVAWLRSQHKAS